MGVNPGKDEHAVLEGEYASAVNDVQDQSFDSAVFLLLCFVIFTTRLFESSLLSCRPAVSWRCLQVEMS